MARAKRKEDHKGVRWLDPCSSHPEGDAHRGEHHECLAGEMRCAYCGQRIDPYPCHNCGKFMTAETMADDDNTHRCEDCR